MMKRIMCLLLVACVTTSTYAQEESKAAKDKGAEKSAKNREAEEIIKKVDAATKAVKTVQYHASLEATGFLKSRFPSRQGTVTIGSKSEDGVRRARFEVGIPASDTAKANTITTGCDGDEYYLINPEKKMVYADIDPAVVGSAGGFAKRLHMREFTHDTPFTDEINSKAEVTGTQVVGGEECYQIHVVYKDKSESIWCFSKKDYLPRRREQVAKRPDGEKGGLIHTITKLNANPKYSEDTFKYEVPEGFTKTDEFAPRNRAMQ